MAGIQCARHAILVSIVVWHSFPKVWLNIKSEMALICLNQKRRGIKSVYLMWNLWNERNEVIRCVNILIVIHQYSFDVIIQSLDNDKYFSTFISEKKCQTKCESPPQGHLTYINNIIRLLLLNDTIVFVYNIIYYGVNLS